MVETNATHDIIADINRCSNTTSKNKTLELAVGNVSLTAVVLEVVTVKIGKEVVVSASKLWSIVKKSLSTRLRL